MSIVSLRLLSSSKSEWSAHPVNNFNLFNLRLRMTIVINSSWMLFGAIVELTSLWVRDRKHSHKRIRWYNEWRWNQYLLKYKLLIIFAMYFARRCWYYQLWVSCLDFLKHSFNQTIQIRKFCDDFLSVCRRFFHKFRNKKGQRWP